jgi:hypothetical protein
MRIRQILRLVVEEIACRIRIKAVMLRLIRPEYGIRTICGPMGQKIRIVGLGKRSLTVWRTHKAEVRDVRHCSAKALSNPTDN